MPNGSTQLVKYLGKETHEWMIHIILNFDSNKHFSLLKYQLLEVWVESINECENQVLVWQHDSNHKFSYLNQEYALIRVTLKAN